MKTFNTMQIIIILYIIFKYSIVTLMNLFKVYFKNKIN